MDGWVRQKLWGICLWYDWFISTDDKKLSEAEALLYCLMGSVCWGPDGWAFPVSKCCRQKLFQNHGLRLPLLYMWQTTDKTHLSLGWHMSRQSLLSLLLARLFTWHSVHHHHQTSHKTTYWVYLKNTSGLDKMTAFDSSNRLLKKHWEKILLFKSNYVFIKSNSKFCYCCHCQSWTCLNLITELYCTCNWTYGCPIYYLWKMARSAKSTQSLSLHLLSMNISWLYLTIYE